MRPQSINCGNPLVGCVEEPIHIASMRPQSINCGNHLDGNTWDEYPACFNEAAVYQLRKFGL